MGIKKPRCAVGGEEIDKETKRASTLIGEVCECHMGHYKEAEAFTISAWFSPSSNIETRHGARFMRKRLKAFFRDAKV